jgi:hypothetical protein
MVRWEVYPWPQRTLAKDACARIKFWVAERVPSRSNRRSIPFWGVGQKTTTSLRSATSVEKSRIRWKDCFAFVCKRCSVWRQYPLFNTPARSAFRAGVGLLTVRCVRDIRLRVEPIGHHPIFCRPGAHVSSLHASVRRLTLRACANTCATCLAKVALVD